MEFYLFTFKCNLILTGYGFYYLDATANNPQYKKWAAHWVYFWYVWGLYLAFYLLFIIGLTDFARQLFKLEFYDLFRDEKMAIHKSEQFLEIEEKK